MAKADTPQLYDITAALGLLSRLPIRVNTDRATARGANAAWAYPLVGLVLGTMAFALGQIALWLGLPHGLTAGLVIAGLVILTGAMHEDGLADCADGFWGGWDKVNRLKIMKDSHIGTYGTIALVLSLGLRWQALSLILGASALWPAVLTAAVLSRTAMVPIMAYLPLARDTGLSRAVGRPGKTTVQVALGIAMLLTLILWQGVGLWVIAVALIAGITCAMIAKTKIGGQTGDVLGATQQITDVAVLLTLAALLS